MLTSATHAPAQAPTPPPSSWAQLRNVVGQLLSGNWCSGAMATLLPPRNGG